MRLIRNTGTDRVLDALRAVVAPGCSLDAATPEVSLFAYAELRELLAGAACRLAGVPANDPAHSV